MIKALQKCKERGRSRNGKYGTERAYSNGASDSGNRIGGECEWQVRDKIFEPCGDDVLGNALMKKKKKTGRNLCLRHDEEREEGSIE